MSKKRNFPQISLVHWKEKNGNQRKRKNCDGPEEVMQKKVGAIHEQKSKRDKDVDWQAEMERID